MKSLNSCMSIRLQVCAATLLFAGQTCFAQPLTITPLKPGAIYDVGEKIGWGISANGQNITSANYTLKKNGLAIYKQGTLDLSSGNATLETSLDEPGAVFLELRTGAGNGSKGVRTLAGALVAPQKLQPSSPKPADFDAFWAAKIKQLHDIPANPVVTPSDGGKPGLDYYLVKMDNMNSAHIYGQLAKPQKEGKFPAVVILQWAGSPIPLDKAWVNDPASKGWLAFNIEPHDLPAEEPKGFYAGKLPNYQNIGQDDKEKSYFLQMYLSAYRAIDYITTRPDWDGKTLVVMGTSMGGQQSLVMAGLHPNVTAVMVCVPAGCDVTGPLHGRAEAFPTWVKSSKANNNDAIVETGRYFDPANFASNIKVPALVAMGFIDETCPPTGSWTAINQMKGPVEVVPMINSGHSETTSGHEQLSYQTRSAEWMDTLARGETLKPDTSLTTGKLNSMKSTVPAP